MAPIAAETRDLEFRLPWRQTCALAAKARCLGLSFDEVVRQALEAYLAKQGEPHGRRD